MNKKLSETWWLAMMLFYFAFAAVCGVIGHGLFWVALIWWLSLNVIELRAEAVE